MISHPSLLFTSYRQNWRQNLFQTWQFLLIFAGSNWQCKTVYPQIDESVIKTNLKIFKSFKWRAKAKILPSGMSPLSFRISLRRFCDVMKQKAQSWAQFRGPAMLWARIIHSRAQWWTAFHRNLALVLLKVKGDHIRLEFSFN